MTPPPRPAPTASRPSGAGGVGQVEHDGGVGGLVADGAGGGVDEGRVAVSHDPVAWGGGGEGRESHIKAKKKELQAPNNQTRAALLWALMCFDVQSSLTVIGCATRKRPEEDAPDWLPQTGRWEDGGFSAYLRGCVRRRGAWAAPASAPC